MGGGKELQCAEKPGKVRVQALCPSEKLIQRGAETQNTPQITFCSFLRAVFWAQGTSLYMLAIKQSQLQCWFLSWLISFLAPNSSPTVKSLC